MDRGFRFCFGRPRKNLKASYIRRSNTYRYPSAMPRPQSYPAPLARRKISPDVVPSCALSSQLLQAFIFAVRPDVVPFPALAAVPQVAGTCAANAFDR
ncbi:hypothetical protein B0H17DRAFT_1050227 [Mycena rosella]|uniref:Uncharacterized protein n=1 Tax=Mycena rosella TaxID=1033263 RepID=A0AAD7GK06_MYCRO|nr:hypothetical protein B0H17DRAFT_1050227 [Mycena rosella]